MKWIFIVIICFLLIVLLVILAKLTIVITYKHDADDDHLTISFQLFFGLIKYRIEVPVIEVATDTPTIETKQTIKKQLSVKQKTKHYSIEDFLNQLHHLKELAEQVIKLNYIVRQFLKKIVVKKFEWHSVVGIGNAAHTGILTGACWAVKGGFIGLVGNFMHMEKRPVVTITPNFQQLISQTRLTCMLQFRIGHAMLAGIKLIKNSKGGRPKLTTRSVKTSIYNEKSIN